jgi:hypothetical protein
MGPSTDHHFEDVSEACPLVVVRDVSVTADQSCYRVVRGVNAVRQDEKTEFSVVVEIR